MEIKRWAPIQQLGIWLWQAALPEFCVQCRAEGDLFCRACRMGWSPSPLVSRLDEEVQSLFSLSSYRDKVIQSFIRAWKYQGVAAARREIFRAMEHAIRHHGDPLPLVDAVVHVPLHPRKINLRGFDQAQEIAEHLAFLLHVPALPLLTRVRFTESQAQTDRSERQASDFASVFALSKDVVGIPQRVLLVDDVWTTGTTLRSAAQVLRGAGVEQVHAFTLARG